MTNTIDHIAVGADSLHQGVKAMETVLGVTLPPGGKHDQMSTHNCLAQLGRNQFFELISIDRDATAPDRTRWFTLDSPKTQSRIKHRPRALCWVVHTTDLDAVVAKSPLDLGEVLTLTRGDRTWKLTVPKDGSLLEEGLIPAFIEWPAGPHPSQAMQNVGIELTSVNLGHPDPDYLKNVLEALSIEQLVTVYKHNTRALSFTLSSAHVDGACEDIVID